MQSWVNIIGLLFDIAGVVGLFLSRSKGLDRIHELNIRISSNLTWDNADRTKKELLEDIDKLKKEINSIIERTNRNNDRIHKKSMMWLILIIIGFILQLTSNIMNIQ